MMKHRARNCFDTEIHSLGDPISNQMLIQNLYMLRDENLVF